MKEKIITWCLLLAIVVQVQGTPAEGYGALSKVWFHKIIHSFRGEGNKNDVRKTRIALVVGMAITSVMLVFALRKLPGYLLLNNAKDKDIEKQTEMKELTEKQKLSFEEEEKMVEEFWTAVTKAYNYARNTKGRSNDNHHQKQVATLLNSLKQQQALLGDKEVNDVFDQVSSFNLAEDRSPSIDNLMVNLSTLYGISFNQEKQLYEWIV